MPLSTPQIKGQDATNFTSYYIILGSLIICSILSYVSYLGICSEACAKSHSYRLYGFTFEFIGMIFFPLLTIFHLMTLRFNIFELITSLMIASGIGAEIFFIYVQKFMIGHWCPLCLSIAAFLGVAGLAKFIFYTKGFTMNTTFRGSISSLALICGFLFAFFGLGQYNELAAEEDSMKVNISFGNQNSPIDVFIFTDWLCPACESLEPTFEDLAPLIMQKARLTFVDDPVHEATLNYSPYNLAFMVNNKANYFALRRGMHKLADKTKEPTEEDIAKMAASYGVHLKELNYGSIAMGTKYFDQLVKKFDIEGTPTIVVYNRETKQSKKLAGLGQIDKAKILNAIDTLSKKP